MERLTNNKIQNFKPYKLPTIKTNIHRNVMKLNLNENISDISSNLMNTLSNTTTNYVSYYSTEEKHIILKENICSFINNGITVENVLLLNGSVNALKLICNIFSNNETRYLIPVPTYSQFNSFAEYNLHKDITYMECNIDEDDTHIFDKIFTSLKKETYTNVYLVNPNQPIGYSLSPEQITTLLISFPETLFILDEAYIEFSNTKCHSQFVLEHKNIIVTRTFSKFFGLAGLRIGYIITHPSNISLLQMCYNQTDITLHSINAACTCLSDVSYYEDQYQYIFTKTTIKNKLMELIAQKPKGLIKNINIRDGMFFLLLSDNPDLLVKVLDQFNIVTSNKDHEITGAVRVTIPPLKFVTKLLDILQTIQSGYFDKCDIMNASTFLIDLDGTLRENGHWSSLTESSKTWFEKITQMKPNTYIVTNNSSHSPLDISQHLNTKLHRVVYPLHVLKFKLPLKSKVYVIGSEQTKTEIINMGYILSCDDCDAIIFANNFCSLRENDWKVVARNIVHESCKIIFCEMEESVYCRDSSEAHYEPYDIDVLLPDMFSLSNVLKNLYNRNDYIILGKPNIEMYDCIEKKEGAIVMIGNSYKNDAQFAKNIGAYPVIIDHSKEVGFDYTCMCYIIHNLYDIL